MVSRNSRTDLWVGKSVAEVKALWLEGHARGDFLSATLDRTQHLTLQQRTLKCPASILPLPKVGEEELDDKGIEQVCGFTMFPADIDEPTLPVGNQLAFRSEFPCLPFVVNFDTVARLRANNGATGTHATPLMHCCFYVDFIYSLNLSLMRCSYDPSRLSPTNVSLFAID